MEILKLLREESLIRRLPFALLFLALGAALFFSFHCFDLVKLAFPWSLSQLTAAKLDGVWVEDDVSCLHREYAREITHQKDGEDLLTGTAYIIFLDSGQSMGLFVHQEGLAEAQALLEKCQTQDGTGELPVLHVSGMVRAMPEQHLTLFRAAAEGDERVESAMLPYYIDVGRLNGWSLAVCWLVLGASCALMALGLGLGIYVLAGGCQRKLKAKAARAGDLAMSLSRVERFYRRTPPLGGVRADKEYVLFRRGAVDILLRPWDVTWAYSIDRRNSSKVVFRTAQEETYTVTMSPMDAQALFHRMEEQTPGVLIGFTDDRAYAYQCDPTFAHRWEAVWPGCTYKM